MDSKTSIMCIQWKKGKLGCAYYLSESLELFLMEDIKESTQFEYTIMLVAQINPGLIIIPDSASDETLFEFLQNEYGTSIETQRVMQRDFSFVKGRYTLLNWYIDHIQVQQKQPEGDSEDMDALANHHIYLRDPDEEHKTHAYLQLEGLIHLDESELTVGCGGVLLKHLQKIEQEQNLNGQNIEDHDSSMQPVMLKAFSCESCLHVNRDTIKSLNIFDLETHPNMHQKREKESLSLFGFLDKTSSVLGKRLLKEWVSRPSRNKHLLDERHASIRFLSQLSVREKVLEITSYLKHIKDIHRLLSRVRESKATSNDWQYILKFAYYTICIFGVLNQWYHNDNHSRQLPFMQKAKKAMSATETLKELGSSIDSIIDFETSKREARTVVKAGVHNDLDLLRERYEKLEDYLLQVSQEISATLPVGLGAALNVVYFPQLGYLITLPQYHFQRTSNGTIGGGGNSSVFSGSGAFSNDYHQRMAGFELQFTTADNLYYKNHKTKELDESIGDIQSMIADKEIEIIQELACCVLKHTQQFVEAVNVFSEIDCFISLTLVALRFNYVQPKMTNDSSLNIVKGRHPLQELCVDVFIPNDIHLMGGKGFHNRDQKQLSSLYGSHGRKHGETLNQTQVSTDSMTTKDNGTNSITVVTGANFSGKSVYLKQIALIVYLSHIGSFVPAESATIGITDKLFTRIQTSETVSKPQSAFGFDLQQLNRALHNTTSNSLVIIDEFGKGTDSSDGAALFCSVLGYFLSLQENCPKILASTHFHDLISKNILSTEDGITLSQTEIMRHQMNETIYEKQGEVKGEEVMFLYRIVPGQAHCASHGIWCASIAGIPTHTIERAMHLSQKYLNGQPIDRIQPRQDQEKYDQLELIQKKFLRTDINDMDPRDLIASIEILFQ